MRTFDWLRGKQKVSELQIECQRATPVNKVIVSLYGAPKEAKVGVAILLACMVFLSCDQAQKPVTDSISMRLVHTQSAQIIYRGLPSNQVDLPGHSLLPVHTATTGEDMPKQYWVSDRELISHTDLASAKFFMPQQLMELYSREEWEKVTKLGINLHRLGYGKTYEEYLDRNRTYSAIKLTFSSSGKSKFASVTSQNLNRQLAIVVDGQVLSAPQILNEIKDGSAMISGRFSKEEVEEIIRKIYGE